MRGLRVRKLADKSVGSRVERFDPVTGEKFLVNPETGLDEAWPLAGVAVEGDAPEVCELPTSWVALGVGEGWIVLEGERVQHQPGGPPGNPWKVTHTFVQADVIVLKCRDGDVRYVVSHQPDKYDDPTEPSGQRVDWFYRVELEV